MIALLYDVHTGAIKELPAYAFGRRWWKTVEWPDMSRVEIDRGSPREISGVVTLHCECRIQPDVSVYVEDGFAHRRQAATWKALEWLVVR